jgi:hypothetical protein
MLQMFILQMKFRFYVDITTKPDSCFVRDHAMWSSDTAELISSHSTVEEFYRFNSNTTCSLPAQSQDLMSNFNYSIPFSAY